MRARIGLVVCAALASACQPSENIPEAMPAPDAHPTTAAINTTVPAPDPTTTTEPVATTTTLAPEPILCPRLPHPAHHDYCPVSTLPRQQSPTPTTAAAITPRSSSATLASIRACESGGDYTTDTGNGYYGAYQFHPGTWRSVGGSGNPAYASPAEQDMRAQMMLDAGRRGEWPNC